MCGGIVGRMHSDYTKPHHRVRFAGNNQVRFPVARSWERDRWNVNSGTLGRGLGMLEHGSTLLEGQLHRPRAARRSRGKFGNVSYEASRFACHRGSVLGEDFKSVVPNGDLRGFLSVFVILTRAARMAAFCVRFRAGIAFTASQHAAAKDQQYQKRGFQGFVNGCDGCLSGS